MNITVFGHSSFKSNLGDEEKILSLLSKISNGERLDFYFGGYGNFDGFVKKCAKKYKETRPDTRLIFVTPYINKWLKNREVYLNVEYDEIVYPEIENVPLKFAISKRNEWMIKNADYILLYVTSDFGGAYNALKYAKAHKKLYYNFGNADIT